MGEQQSNRRRHILTEATLQTLYKRLRPIVNQWEPENTLSHILYIFKIKQIHAWIPFTTDGGVFWDPRDGQALVYTDCPQIDDWVNIHRDHITEFWQKTTTLRQPGYTQIRRSELRGTGETTQEKHLRQWAIIKPKLDAGVKQVDLANELDVSCTHIQLLKRKFKETA